VRGGINKEAFLPAGKERGFLKGIGRGGEWGVVSSRKKRSGGGGGGAGPGHRCCPALEKKRASSGELLKGIGGEDELRRWW